MVTTLMQEKLTEAISQKQVDINSFIWKGHKVLDETGKYKQSEKQLVAMSESELNGCYEHCKTMLYNKDTQNPGRYIVLETIADQKDRCGAELVLRYLDQEKGLSRFTLLNIINKFLETNKEALKNYKPLISDMFDGIPNEFTQIPLSLLIDGCLDRLGAFNKKHITRTFILKQGIWLTPAESKELTELTETGVMRDKLSIIKERLNIKEGIEKLYINSKGLNFTQMRAMLNLKPNKKYMDLTTVQLETLRNRILFDLEETVKNHIAAWERRMAEIEMVAEFKGFKLR
jgi:hypothetical protein